MGYKKQHRKESGGVVEASCTCTGTGRRAWLDKARREGLDQELAWVCGMEQKLVVEAQGRRSCL